MHRSASPRSAEHLPHVHYGVIGCG